jgi:hypothetical protein
MLLQIVLDQRPVARVPEVGYLPVLVQSEKTTKGVALSGRESTPDTEGVLGDQTIEETLKDDGADNTRICATTYGFGSGCD